MYKQIVIEIILTVITIAFGSVQQNRWCLVNDGVNITSETYIQYNDSVAACITCGNLTRLFTNRNDPSNEVCCENVFSSVCELCSNSTREGCVLGSFTGLEFCPTYQHCDGYNDCGNGHDETHTAERPCMMTTSECQPGEYVCAGSLTQCFQPTQVCNNVKDCFSGSDEVNCLYYGGRCEGFLCTEMPMCLPASVVCDFKKDCLDGSDEVNCLPTCVDPDPKFLCNNITGGVLFNSCEQNTVSSSVVCDGNADCSTGRDEIFCYDWTQWGAWSSCNCQPNQENGTISRSRSCATFRNIDLHTQGQCSGERDEENICSCAIETTTESTTTTTEAPTTQLPGLLISIELLAIVVLASVITIIAICAIIYCLCRRSKKDSITQRVPTIRTQQPSPRGDHISLHETVSVHSRRPVSQISHLTTRPLPSTSSRDPDYSSIDDLREQSIDPYAQTPFKPKASVHGSTKSLLGSSLSVRGSMHSLVSSTTPSIEQDPDISYAVLQHPGGNEDNYGYMLPVPSSESKQRLQVRNHQYTIMKSPNRTMSSTSSTDKGKKSPLFLPESDKLYVGSEIDIVDLPDEIPEQNEGLKSTHGNDGYTKVDKIKHGKKSHLKASAIECSTIKEVDENNEDANSKNKEKTAEQPSTSTILSSENIQKPGEQTESGRGTTSKSNSPKETANMESPNYKPVPRKRQTVKVTESPVKISAIENLSKSPGPSTAEESVQSKDLKKEITPAKSTDLIPNEPEIPSKN